jgi:hypothetical protein
VITSARCMATCCPDRSGVAEFDTRAVWAPPQDQISRCRLLHKFTLSELKFGHMAYSDDK